MDKTHIINELINRYSDGKKSKFAKKLGISPQAVSTWLNRGTFDIELIYAKCENISPDWLLTGNGEMLTTSNTVQATGGDTATKATATLSPVGIPLIPIDAMAGFMTGNSEQVLEHECTRYIIPAFRDAEFLISVRGSSMCPKYNSGDIVACRKVSIGRFFQWNKVYVLDTEDGALIKRIHESDKENYIKLSSDNPEYKPFDVALSDIYSIAIVVGVIRAE